MYMYIHCKHFGIKYMHYGYMIVMVINHVIIIKLQ